MAKQLYTLAYEEMVKLHAVEFTAFAKIHEQYKKDQTTWQSKFDALGKPLVRIITETENRLCQKMEGGVHGKFSANLAEKFRAEVRTHFPLIDFVGVTIS